MPKFSPSSVKQLSTAHPDLQVLFFEVIRSKDCTVIEGHRGEAAQNEAFAKGNSKLKWPNGKHNKFPSHAVDVAPYPIPDWKKTSEFIYFGGYVMGIAEMLFQQGKMKHKIRYGGDFNQNDRVTDQSFVDAVHFEIIT